MENNHLGLVELTESDRVEHAGVRWSRYTLVDDADAVLHRPLVHVDVQARHKEGHKQPVYQVLGQAHHHTHPVSRKVSHSSPKKENTSIHDGQE